MASCGGLRFLVYGVLVFYFKYLVIIPVFRKAIVYKCRILVVFRRDVLLFLLEIFRVGRLKCIVFTMFYFNYLVVILLRH